MLKNIAPILLGIFMICTLLTLMFVFENPILNL